MIETYQTCGSSSTKIHGQIDILSIAVQRTLHVMIAWNHPWKSGGRLRHLKCDGSEYLSNMSNVLRGKNAKIPQELSQAAREGATVLVSKVGIAICHAGRPIHQWPSIQTCQERICTVKDIADLPCEESVPS
jgi:hypothetical protein